MLLIGAFLKGKKKKSPEQGEAKPFTAQGSLGKLKDMSKEMYQEIQKEIQQDPRTQERKEIPRMQRAPITRNPVVANSAPIDIELPRKESRTNVSKERTNRRAATSRDSAKKKQTVSKTNIIPENRDDVIKGIVFSEIFGPPISKR